MHLTYYDNWNNDNYNEFINNLNILSETKYKEFNNKIILTKYKMIGIRVPVIKEICKNLYKTNYISFINCKNNNIYEEILIKGLLISYIKDINSFIIYLDYYTKYIDNWALCDLAISSYKIIKNNKEIIFLKVKDYLKSKKAFTIRVGIVILLNYYLIDEYIDEVLNLIKTINNHDYYVDMAIGWLLCEAYIKYPKKVIKTIKSNILTDNITNITISKIRDSKRVINEDKINILKYKK